MSIEISRRDLLQAAPAAAAVASAPAIAMTAPASRAEWNTAMRAYERALAASRDFIPVYQSKYEQCNAACERVPHVEIAPTSYSGRIAPFSTADVHEVSRARSDTKALAEGRMKLDDMPGLREYYERLAELAKAADDRDAKVQAIRDRFDMDAADEMAEALGNREYETQARLMKMPAPDLAALRWKLDLCREEDGEMAPWGADYIAQTFADIARLLPEGA